MGFVPPGTVPGPPPVSNSSFDAPGSQPLSIGPVTFWSNECPSRLPIGAVEQKESVTELVGGGKVTHPLGPQLSLVSWEGTFLAANVSNRINALRQMCVLGSEYEVTYGGEKYYCIVQEFTPTYRHQWRAEYKITLEITRDANGVLSGTIPPTTQQQVNMLVANAIAVDNSLLGQDTGASSFQQLLADLQLALAAAGDLGDLTGTSLASITNAITAALSGIGDYMAGQSPYSSTYLLALSLSNIVTLIGKNLALGQNQQTIQVQGGSLYAIASKYYGDPSQAAALMAANDLSTAILPNGVVTTLVLPNL